MINNTIRKDKFIGMTKDEYNLCLAFALRNCDKSVTYCYKKDGLYFGGLADSFEHALEWCNFFYKEDSSADFSIGDFSNGGTLLWDKNSILHKLGIMSDAEYDLYIDSIELDD